MTDMTRAEAIEMLKSMKYEDDENCLENQALDMAIASLTIDEKYDLEFARNEEDIKPVEKTGRWIEKEVMLCKNAGVEELQSVQCNVCYRFLTTPYLYRIYHHNYCPYCGARMEVEDESL